MFEDTNCNWLIHISYFSRISERKLRHLHHPVKQFHNLLLLRNLLQSQQLRRVLLLPAKQASPQAMVLDVILPQQQVHQRLPRNPRRKSNVRFAQLGQLKPQLVVHLESLFLKPIQLKILLLAVVVLLDLGLGTLNCYPSKLVVLECNKMHI